ncbi:hypothetical protein LCGC14_0572140 [marine sediment metagenome]|uniref:Uncharacterized protein n=1 Tax=marine sediment metagenome TaxID=412755 RepID=A0A0F9U564_9ZZZZ
MKQVKYYKSRIERVCEMCQKPIRKGNLYRMIRHLSETAWPICFNCDKTEPISWV